MPFEKGKSGNPAGRPAGKPNKTTEELRQLFAQFLDANIDRMQEIFDNLEPKDQLNFIERCARLVMPMPLHPISKLTDSEIDEIINFLKNNQ